MSRRRKKKKHGQESVELNLAAMLDMAFQLLTFFILTFKPAPVEGQISLRLPPPAPVTGAKSAPSVGQKDSDDPVKSLDSLVINVFGDRSGRIGQTTVGEETFSTLGALEQKVRSAFGNPQSTFEQVVIQVTSDVSYSELMRVVDICTRQTLANGQKLSKLSFQELATGGT